MTTKGTLAYVTTSKLSPGKRSTICLHGIMARCDSIPSTSTRSTRVTFSKVEFSKFVGLSSLGIFTIRIGVVGFLVGGEVVEDWGGEGCRLTMIAENNFVD